MAGTDKMEDVVGSALKAAALASLASIRDDVMSRLVSNLIDRKVDKRTGRDDGYSSDKVPYIDYLFTTELERVLAETVREYVTQNKDAIKTGLRARLQARDGFVDKVVANIEQNLAAEWRISVNLSLS